MAISGFELQNRTITQDRITRRYRVDGAIVETDVIDFVDSLPAALGGMYRNDWQAEETDEEDESYDLVVNWGRPSGGFVQDVDTTEFRFNFQMGGGKFKQSLATIESYYDSSQLGFGAPDYEGAINVVVDSGKLKVEGEDISPPPEVFTLSYRANAISKFQQDLYLSMCGHVNSTSFRGYTAGSLCLVRVTGGRDNSGVWTVEFGFGYIPNQTNIPVGDIDTDSGGSPATVAKDGFDLLWVLYRTTTDAAAKLSIQKPAAAFVERIFYRSDFNSLGLPS